MRLRILVELSDDDAGTLWGYGLDEIMVPDPDETMMDLGLRSAEKILDGIDTAKAAVSAQISASAKNLERRGE